MSDGRQYPTDDDLRALPGAGQPPAGLEDRVVHALRAHGLLEGRRRGRRLWLLAAGLACFAAGWFAREPSTRDRGAGNGALYLLLLSELPEPADAAEEGRLVEEYRAWAVALHRRNRLVRGEKLGGQTRVVGAERPRPGALVDASGFFLIRAHSLEEAVSMARDCPHVRHGGTITVRSVDPT